ncbi:MAG: helicase-associated domain-containing protein, partial [Candidatus Fermentibacterota bacterium]
VVQPDFSVVFMAPSPGAEVVLSQFAERTGREVGAVFRITEEGVMRAASAGIGPKSILSELEALSQRKVPENVVRQIEQWCGRCRRIGRKSVILIRCPDAETALRVKSAGKGKLERLNDTDLALADRKALKTITRKLREKGITFE